jgi:hypothetical protein
MAKKVHDEPAANGYPAWEGIELSKAEALDLITLLAAQLAQEAAIGRTSGACPEVNISDRGVINRRMVFNVKK